VSINSLPGFGVERRGMDLADPAIEPAVGFYTLHGSYFCEWNIDDNFMRSVLATPNYGYAAVWNRGNSLLFERLGVGETLGEGFLRMQNEGWVKPQLTLGLLGDPSLRLRTAAPPLNPKAETRSGDVVLTWKSPAAGAAGFFVYRSTSALAGPFKRLGTVPGGESRFTDTNAPAGNKLYQIRSASLEVTGSGSYTNLSQAAFISAK
jgi:hypothetical protein